MTYFSHSDEYSISDEIATAVKKSLSQLDDSQLADIRNSVDNSIEFRYDVHDLGVDVPVDKISPYAYIPYTIAGSGDSPLYVADIKKNCNKMKITGTTVTVTIAVFDRTKDRIDVWDDYFGQQYAIRMSKYESFDAALTAALEGTAPDAMHWLEKEEEA